MTEQANRINLPWWKHGFVWMVIAGPLVVVIAGFVTFYLAVSHPNEIVYEPTKSETKTFNQSGIVRPNGIGDAPAMQGRNHAATGVIPQGK